MKILRIGNDCVVNTGKVKAMTTTVSKPTRDVMRDAKKANMFISATRGEKTQTVIFMEDGSLIGSGLTTDELIEKMNE